MTRRVRDDKGMSVAVEAAILLPCLVLMIGAVICGGRVGFARQAIAGTAAEGARVASIARNAEEARARANAAVASSLALHELRCESAEAVIDASGFSRPIGAPAQVSVTVTCVMSMSDISVPGIPGTITFTQTAGSPIDAYRGR